MRTPCPRPPKDLCLLISTYDRYRPIAEFARTMIGRYWPSPPSIFTCGCSASRTDGDLPLRDPPADWIAIHHSAATDLLAAGYRRLYYIMDDCPPLGPCHGTHLNQTLPDLLTELEASYISLVGWDQKRASPGKILGPRWHRVQRQASDFAWQFSTDPCLWNLEAFRDILAALMNTEDPKARTAWAFERRIGRDPSLVPERWRGTAYRICGLRMLAGRLPRLRALLIPAGYAAYDLARLATRLLAGPRALTRLDDHVSSEVHFYDGPYPTYWAGVMTKGEINVNVIRFLKRHGRSEYLRLLLRHAEQVRR